MKIAFSPSIFFNTDVPDDLTLDSTGPGPNF